MRPLHRPLPEAAHRATGTPPSRRLRDFGRRLRGLVASRSMAFADALLQWMPVGRGSGEILIVRLDAIGDFVLWLDAAKELRRLFPGQRLVLAGNAIWADLATKIDHWDEVWPVDVARTSRLSRYRLHLLWRVRRRGFAQAIQPTYSRIRNIGDALVHASGAPQRRGSQGDLSNMDRRSKAIADRWYTQLVAAVPAPTMEIERNAEFVRGLGLASFAGACPRIAKLGELPVRLRVPGRYRVVVPGASANFRQWPPERFAATVNQLDATRPATTVLCGSRSERALCDDVASKVGGDVINLAGETALWEMVEVIRDAELLISNETSAVHIGAAVDTPVVCILGGGHYGRFMPYGDVVAAPEAPLAVTHPMTCFGCNWRCTQPHPSDGPVPCISGISVVDVLHASERAVAA